MNNSNNIITGEISVNGNNSAGNGSVGVSLQNTNEDAPRQSASDHLLTVIPYIVHESSLAREERHSKKLVIALIVSIVTLFLTNAAWLWYLSQYDFSEEWVELNADSGNANYIGQDGDIYNGEYQG